MLVGAALVFQIHVAEEFNRVLADLLVGGNEAEVGVEAGGLFVVVARAQLGNVLQAVGRAARDGANLAVHLAVLAR